MRRRFLVFALIALLSVCLAVGLFRQDAADAAYLTAPVERGDLRMTLSATGSLSALVTVQVGSQLSGQISELLADFNDEVTKGQPIARLDPSTFEARVRQSEAALDVAREGVEMARQALAKARADTASVRQRRLAAAARVEKAQARVVETQRDLDRKRSLAGKLLAQAHIDHAAAEYEMAAADGRAAQAEREVTEQGITAAAAGLRMAEANLLHAEAAERQQAAALEQARIDLARTVIYAPIDGVVISRNVDRGQTVAASLEAPTLFTIAQDLRRMEVLATIDEADIGRIRVGQRATFRVDAYPRRVFTGTVREIRKAPRVVQNVVTYVAALAADNPDLALLPGMTATVQVAIAEVNDVVKIPNAALRFRPADAAVSVAGMKSAHAAESPAGTGTASVWLIGADGRPTPVPVKIGRSDANATELVDGPLQAGQQVIVGVATAAGGHGWLGSSRGR